MEQQQRKGCTKTRRPKGRGARNAIENMLRRAVRVYKRTLYLGMRAARKAPAGEKIELSGIALGRAHSQAMLCAQAHGPVVATRFEIWLRSLS